MTRRKNPQKHIANRSTALHLKQKATEADVGAQKSREQPALHNRRASRRSLTVQDVEDYLAAAMRRLQEERTRKTPISDQGGLEMS